MKRIILTTAVIAALAAPAAAMAGTSLDASGKLGAAKGTDFSIRFKVITQNNKPIGVDNFKVRNVSGECDQGPALLSFNLNADPGTFPVSNRGRFNAQGSNGSTSVQVKGKFKNRHKVKGRVRAEGEFEEQGGGTLTNCLATRDYTAGN